MFLRKFTKLGYKVLLMVEPIDEFMIQKLNKYEDFDLVNITKDDVKLPEDTLNVQEKEYEDLCSFMKKSLSEKVESVKLSTRLVNEPTCIVTSKFGWSANMERIMKAQALGDNRNMMFMQGKKILEINPEHKIINKLKQLVGTNKKEETTAEVKEEPTGEAKEEPTDDVKEEIKPELKEAEDLTHLLYDVALLNAGFTVDNMTSFSEKLFQLIL
jgi:HSP90 family molecular chaperone